MIACGKCGTHLVDGSTFCHMCGTKVLYKDLVCKKCGQTLSAGSRFCGKCGNPVAQTTNTSNVPTPKQPNSTYNCPNCGAAVGAMDMACRSCGAQVTYRGIPKSVSEFAAELARIEAEAPDEAYITQKGIFGETYSLNAKREERLHGSKTLDKKLSFIKSFPIPNTTEEIVEFILLAIANIDVKYGNKIYDTHRFGRPGGDYYADVALATTWIGKLEQAYNKAMLLFPDDPMFPKIQQLYVNKMREMERM